MPLAPLSLLYRLGLTTDLCPACGTQLPARVVVDGTTAVDVIDVWMEDGEEHYDEIRIVCVTSRTAPPKEPLTEPRAEQS